MVDQVYQTSVVADTSGYVSSLQQATLVTEQFVAANEGATGAVGRLAGGAMMRVNQAFGGMLASQRASVSEFASLEQQLGGVSAKAVAAGKSVSDATRATRDLAKNLTGSVAAAADVVQATQSMGYTDNRALRDAAKLMVELSAATGEAGGQVTESLQQMSRSMGRGIGIESLRAQADALVGVTAKFGGSVSEVAAFGSQIGSFADQVGLGTAEVIGLGTAFSRAGEAGQRSSTVFSTVLSDIDKAVREGQPTLRLYADTMGMSVIEAKKLAEVDPSEFFLRWVESINTSGPEAIKNLELLFGEGVRTQRSLRALANSGDLRGMVDDAYAQMGQGTTADSAAEQINGLNESFARLSETMRLTVANAGAPYTGLLRTITDLTQKAASGVESFTSSGLFQALATTGVGVGIAGKAVGATYMAGGLLPLVGMARRGLSGRFDDARETLRANRGRTALIGGGLLAAGAATGNDMYTALGIGGTILAAGAGDTAFRAASWLTRTSGTDIGDNLRNIPAVLRGEPVERSATYAQRYSRARNPDLSVDEAFGHRMNLVNSRTEQQAVRTGLRNELKGMDWVEGKEFLDRYDKVTTRVGQNGQLLVAAQLGNLASLVGTEEFSPGRFGDALKDMEKRVEGDIKRAQAAVTDADIEFVRQQRLWNKDAPEDEIRKGVESSRQNQARRMYTVKQGAAGLGNLATGMLSAAGLPFQLLANPYVLAGGVAALGVGGAVNSVVNEFQARDKRKDPTIEGAQRIAAAYDLPTVEFRGLSWETEKVTTSFRDLAGVVDERLVAERRLTQYEYQSLSGEGDPVAALRYQNFMVGDWAVGRQVNTDESIGEIIAKFGTRGDQGTAAAIAEEFRRMGKDADEYGIAADRVAEVWAKGPEGVMELAAELSANRKFGDEDLGAEILKRYSADNPNLSGEFVSMQYLEGVADRYYEGAIGIGGVEKAIGALEDMLGTSLDDVGFDTDAFIDALKNDRSELTPTFKTVAGPNGNNARVTDEVSYYTDADGRRIYPGQLPGYAPEGSITLEQYEEENDLRSATDRALSEARSRVLSGSEAVAGSDRLIQAGISPELMPGSDFAQAVFDNLKAEAYDTSFGVPQSDLTGNTPAFGQVDAILENTQANRELADEFASLGDTLDIGDAAEIQGAGQDLFAGMQGVTGGDTAATALELQRLVWTSPEGSVQRAVAQQAVGQADYARSLELSEMSPVEAAAAVASDATAEYATAMVTAAATGGITQEELDGLQQTMQAAQDNYRQTLQNQLRATEQFNRQMSWAQEDFERQSEETRQDHYRQMAHMAEDFRTSQVRAEREYNKQRDRANQDFNKATNRAMADYRLSVKRAAEDAAESMADPFSRVRVESTWSGEGLVSNLKEQAQQFKRQLKALDELREMGLDQSTIDMLGLADPDKAQQAYRLLLEAQEDPSFLKDLNNQAGQRENIAGRLFGVGNSKEAARAREDFERSLRRNEKDFKESMQRMAEDRKQWVEDSTADYNKAVARANDAFQRMYERMTAAHKRAMNRAAEQFADVFKVYTADIAKLEKKLNQELKGIPGQMSKSASEGLDKVKDHLEKKGPEIIVDTAKALEKAASAIISSEAKDDEAAAKLIKQLAAILGMTQASGGGPGAGAPVSAPDSSYEGGSFKTTGGQGNLSALYGQPGKWAKGYHTGTDIAVPVGTPLFSSVSGEVVSAFYDKSYGNMVTIKQKGEAAHMLYAHMHSFGVKKGDVVNQGTFIGYSGNTGNSTGPHVHIERRTPPYEYGNKDVNPKGYLYTGGIVNQPGTYMVGEGGPEAVIPFDHRGVGALAKALEQAFGVFAGTSMGLRPEPVVLAPVNNDRRVMVTGPITVKSEDPDVMARKLERVARQRALVPHGSVS